MICKFPNCGLGTSKTGNKEGQYRRWCWNHSQGAGKKEREKYAEGIELLNPNYRHGMNRTRPHRIWGAMKKRCKNKKNISYQWYGGKGIKVCERWQSFENFWEDMKEGYSDELSIDRIDGTKDYMPGNCRWATAQQQTDNRVVKTH